MIRYYNNRELSYSFDINLARWKRWTREFLQPDPLGGLQSGYARQFSMREAFLVALGGHLVGFLKFSVHQAKIILADLEPWLENNGYFKWDQESIKGEDFEEKIRKKHYIYLRSPDSKYGLITKFYYAIYQCPPLNQSAFKTTEKKNPSKDVIFINTPAKIQKRFAASPFLVLLCIGQFRQYFLSRLHP